MSTSSHEQCNPAAPPIEVNVRKRAVPRSSIRGYQSAASTRRRVDKSGVRMKKLLQRAERDLQYRADPGCSGGEQWPTIALVTE